MRSFALIAPYRGRPPRRSWGRTIIRLGTANKFRARKTEIDGITFASAKEGARYLELKYLQLAGEISELQLQVAFPIVINGQLVCKYVCDATYRDKTGTVIVEDTKSAITRKNPVYRLKYKLMRAVHGITISEA